MTADFWTIKTRARRDIHAVFRIAALYQDATMAQAAEVHVRWHDRMARPIGNLPGGDYAEVFENIDGVIFSDEELSALGIVPMRNGSLIFPQFDNFRLTLDARQPKDGPIKVIWTIQRPKQPAFTAPPAASDILRTDGGNDVLTTSDSQIRVL